MVNIIAPSASKTHRFSIIDRRSATYSDRPRLIVAGELMTGGMALAFMPYGQRYEASLLFIRYLMCTRLCRWRKERRAVHDAFNSREAQAYQELQEREAAQLVMRLMSDSDGWQEKFERCVAQVLAVESPVSHRMQIYGLHYSVSNLWHRHCREKPGGHCQRGGPPDPRYFPRSREGDPPS